MKDVAGLAMLSCIMHSLQAIYVWVPVDLRDVVIASDMLQALDTNVWKSLHGTLLRCKMPQVR